MRESLSILSILLIPLVARTEPIDSTLILFAQFGDARMTASAVLIDTEERWAISAYHFIRSGKNPVALLPLRDAQGKLTNDPEPYWQRLNAGDVFEVRPRWLSKSDDLALFELPRLAPTASAMPLARRDAATKSTHELIGHPISRGICFERSTATLLAISPMKWDWSNQRIDSRFLRLEGKAPFPSGYSGGPVVNEKNELTGMVVASPDSNGNVVYATDARPIRSFLTRVYVLESWKAFAAGDPKRAGRRLDKASSLEPYSIPTRVSRWLMARLEH